MAVSTVPRGLIIDLITPLEPSGGIDRRGVQLLLDRIAPHVQGILLCGPGAGDGVSVGQAQRAEMLETALDHGNGRTPLMVWITGESTEETIDSVKELEALLQARDHHGPVAWVDMPLLYHSNRGLPQHYRELAESVRRPILLMNDPERVKQGARPLKRANIRTGILKEIAHVQEVQGVFFRGPLERARNYRKATRSRNDFRMYDGDEASFLSHPSRHGVLSPGANLAPATWGKVTAASLEPTGDQPGYPDRLQQILERGRYLEALRGTYADHPSARIRAALARAGVLEASDAEPTDPQTQQAVVRLYELMKAHGDA
jgi:dihydrodipicolinate synthase/N-acetylneuraminate lyase